MAITEQGRPQDFTPVYNEMNFYFDSSNKVKPGFRYIFDLYEVGNPTKITESRGAPRPGDGFGEYKAARLLKPLVKRTFNPLNFISQNADDNYVKFEIKVGEAFIEDWAYDDYQFNVNPGIYSGFTKLVAFVQIPANAHSFQVGDQINVIQDDGGALKPAISGLQTVVEVLNDWEIVLGIPWVGSGPAIGGDIGFADGRKTVIRDLLTVTGVAYNGAFTVPDFLNYNELDFKLLSPTGMRRILTTLPRNDYRIKKGSDMWLNFVQAELAVAQWAYFENSNGDVFRRPIANPTKYIRQFYAGANDTSLTPVVGALPLIKDDTEYYDVWIVDAGGLPVTLKYRLDIDKRCTIEDFNVLFEDRLGSFIPFSFQLRAQKDTRVQRTEYEKELGDLNTALDKWTYDTYAEGASTINVEQDKEYLVRTNFMNRVENEYYEEFISSPNHFVKINGVYLSCKLKTLSTTTQGEGTRKRVRKELVFKLSNQDPVNI